MASSFTIYSYPLLFSPTTSEDLSKRSNTRTLSGTLGSTSSQMSKENFGDRSSWITAFDISRQIEIHFIEYIFYISRQIKLHLTEYCKCTINGGNDIGDEYRYLMKCNLFSNQGGNVFKVFLYHAKYAEIQNKYYQ